MRLGVALAKHSKLGVSPISSVENVVSVKLDILTFGTWLIISNFALVVGQILLLRKNSNLLNCCRCHSRFVFRKAWGHKGGNGYFCVLCVTCSEVLPTTLSQTSDRDYYKIKRGDLMVNHPFPPLYNEKSKILILGSFPSVKSREQMFFYGHPQNRFWKVIAEVFESDTPGTIPEKQEFLLSHGIALWDVIASCEIVGSSDSSIKNVKANDLSEILNSSDIRRIFVNGKTAEKYYNKYTKNKLDREVICLPSTSPANAAWSMERLVQAWKIIKAEE